MGPQLHETRMGQRLIEGTLPRLAEELERLNQNLEALVRELQARREEKEKKEKTGQR